MTTVPFADWQKIDFRVGKILSVENHPNADKLYVLRVDLGSETRTVVAGLRKHYTPEELVGKLVVVFANIEPVLLRGVKSEGMILAAVDGEENVVVLSPEKDVAVGSKVR